MFLVHKRACGARGTPGSLMEGLFCYFWCAKWLARHAVHLDVALSRVVAAMTAYRMAAAITAYRTVAATPTASGDHDHSSDNALASTVERSNA